MRKKHLVVLLGSLLFVYGCGGSDDDDGAEMEEFDLRSAIVTGPDESSTGLWDCVFDDIDNSAAEQLRNTVAFWENDRGINGSGLLFGWEIVGDTIEGTYDPGTRTFVLDQLVFNEDNTTLTAGVVSTFDVGSPDQEVFNYDSTCNRM